MSDPTLGNSPWQDNAADAPPKAGFRMWPAIAIAAVIVLARVWANTGEMAAIKFTIGLFLTPIVCFVAMLVWWGFFSRLPRFDRLLAIGVLATVTVITVLVAEKSFRNLALMFYVMPAMLVCWAVWLLLSIYLPWPVRRNGILAVFAACGIIKPYFNDLVVVDDNIYGIDGGALLCVSMSDGNLKWRTSAHGAGQILLLADQKLLLVMAERGDVALVKAQAEKYEELCRFKALEGKTWNHPVIAHEKLFVRNGEEIACFKLELLDGSDSNGAKPKATEPAKKVAAVSDGGDQKSRDLK